MRAKNNDESMPKRLQFFRGYIIDKRLGEFRKIYLKNDQPTIQFIPFSSKKGRKLLRGWTIRRGRIEER